MKVSVIIPCHNASAYLGDTIHSVLAQTEPPEEIIVVDDASTDGSRLIAQRFESRVRLVSVQNGNASATRNRGADLARGDALMFLDADDLLGPTALESLVTALHRHPDAIALCPWFRRVHENGAWFNRPPSCEPRRPGQHPLDAWLTGWYHPPCSVLWSRSAYEHVGGWDPAIGVNDDGHIMLRALAMGVPLETTEAGSAFYRRLPEGETSLSALRFTARGLRSRIQVLDEIRRVLFVQQRLADHSVALAAAYDLVAADCVGRFNDAHLVCRRAARALAGPGPMRAARRLQHRVIRRLHRRRQQYPMPAWIPPLTAEDSGSAASASAAIKVTGGTPAVSVILPTFNRARLLPRALASVLAQSFKDIEILVVDDGSTDDTESIVRGIEDRRVRYLRLPCNRGPSAARNAGLRAAQGEFIAFLDSDDEWLPGKLAAQVALFRRLPAKVGLVYSLCESVDGDGRSRLVEWQPRRGNLAGALLEANVLHGAGSSALLRRAAMVEAGMFDESMRALEDWDYWLRIALAYEVDCVAAPLTRYHDAACGEAGISVARVSRDVVANLEAREYFYRKHRQAMTEAGVEHRFLLESARRHLKCNVAIGQARRLIVRAITARPLDAAIYPWLVLMLLPWPARERLRRLRRDLLAGTPGLAGSNG